MISVTGNSLKQKMKFRDVLRDWASSSTSHGIPRIASSNYTIIKIIWTVFFIIALGASFMTLKKTFENYFSYPVVTQIKRKTMPSTEFPTVTICSQNPFKINNLDSESKIYFENILNIRLQNLNQMDQPQLGPVLMSLDQMSKSHIAEKIFDIKNRKHLSNSLNETLISCTFNIQECTAKDFDELYINAYGFCYQFNAGKNKPKKSITNPGKITGLMLDLYAGKPESQLTFSKSYGMTLFIHNSSITPFGFTDEIFVPVGFETNIALNRVLIKKMPPPYSDCGESASSDLNNKVVQGIYNMNGVYRQKHCMHLCYQEYLIEKCGCYELNSFYIHHSVPCNIEMILNCVYPAITGFFNGSESSQCVEKCPTECELYNYEMKISQSTFPTPLYANLIVNYTNNRIRKLKTIEDVKETSLAINIYFEELTLTEIEEQPETNFPKFLSEIGGSLGYITF
jgi:hypothetical protein